jgi:signal transduction histidine kinase
MSSLVAWLQNLRDIFPENLDLVDITDEMDKDLDALKLVAERFSKIGSPPKPTPQNLALLLKKSLDYVVPRAPKTIKYKFPDLANQPEISVMANPMLMDWVFENLLKNALDAMDGKGEIEVSLGIDSKKIGYVEISDTGKGIPKNKWTTIFKPGYTTKTRGWGLGLSLTHRIVVQNHHGKIFVKRSEIDKGTTFRIEIPLAPSKA